MTTPVPNHVPKPDLFSKVGPLPAWGWGVVLIGGYLIYSRFISHPNVAQAVDNPTATDPGAYSDSGGFPLSVGTGAGAGGGSSSAVDPSSSGYNYNDVLSQDYTGSVTGTGFATNQQWAVSVISNMPKMGYSPSEVTTAVTLYLAGAALNTGQANIISVAIGNYGPPPLPLPITAATPTPAPGTTTPVPTTTAIHKMTYTTKAGDTLHSVASAWHLTDTQLLTLNPKSPARTPSAKFPVGTVLRVEL